MPKITQAISSLLREELTKIAEAAEAERKGALQKKLRRVTRRSGGLCNPEQLETLVRNSSFTATLSPTTGTSSPVSMSTPTLPPPGANPTFSAWVGGGGSGTKPPAPVPLTGQHSGLLGLGSASSGDAAAGGNSALGGGDAGGGVGSGGSSSVNADVPWADNLLSVANRRRHGGMLRARGRGLAKGLAALVPAAAREVHGVAARLQLWEEDSTTEGGDISAAVSFYWCGSV